MCRVGKPSSSVCIRPGSKSKPCSFICGAAVTSTTRVWKSAAPAIRCAARPLSCFAQINELPDLKHAFPAYQELPSHVLQDVLRRLDKAFAAFFRRIRNGETPGYPRFVRHEAAFTTVVPGSPGHNPLFCQWFPTGTCVSGNAGVRSFRDKSILASAVREV